MDIKQKQTVKNFRLLIQKYTQFWFFRKGSATSFSTIFSVWFFKKNVSQLYSINWPNFIAWLSLLVDILGKRCIIIICFPICNDMNFEINLRFLIRPFSYIIEKSEQKTKYFQRKKSFLGAIKSVFHYFKRAFNC